MITDAQGAKDAGLHAVWLNRQGGEPPPGIHLITDLQDLPELLLNAGTAVPTPRR